MPSDESVIRGVLPRNGPKLLARLMSVPVETARHWYYRTLSAARRQELALRLLDELDRQDRIRAAYREHLCRMVDFNEEMAGARGSLVRMEDRRASTRAKVG